MARLSRQLRDQISIYGSAFVVSAAAVAAAVWWIGPAPPSTIAFATGAPGGAYERWGAAYDRALEEIGIEVELVASKGAVENLRLMETGRVDVGFLQSGLPLDGDPPVEALASLAPEPAWIFAREDIATLRALAGARIAGGGEGSGTLAFSRRLIDIAGLDSGGTQVLPLGAGAAAEALQAGQVDAAIFISAVANDQVRTLLSDESVRLVTVDDAAGLTRAHPWLTRASLLGGAIDYRADVPPEAVSLLSTTALLVARSDLHPAIIDALMGAAGSINDERGLFAPAGAYPRPPETQLPVNADAVRYLEDGPTFLRRYLPFWVASFVERAWILVLPLLTVMFPLFRIAPPTYRWRISRRINRHYLELQRLDRSLAVPLPPAEQEQLLRLLDDMDRKAARTNVPVAFMSDVYHLRRNIAMVRGRVGEIPARDGAQPQSPIPDEKNPA